MFKKWYYRILIYTKKYNFIKINYIYFTSWNIYDHINITMYITEIISTFKYILFKIKIIIFTALIYLDLIYLIIPLQIIFNLILTYNIRIFKILVWTIKL